MWVSLYFLSPAMHKIGLQACAKEQRIHYYQVHSLHHSSQFFQFLQRIQYLKDIIHLLFLLHFTKEPYRPFRVPWTPFLLPRWWANQKQHPQLHKAEPSCKHELEGYHNLSSSIFTEVHLVLKKDSKSWEEKQEGSSYSVPISTMGRVQTAAKGTDKKKKF